MVPRTTLPRREGDGDGGGAVSGVAVIDFSAFLNGKIGSVIYSGALPHHNNTIADFL